MSAGYWYGGRVADKSASDRGLAVILSVAAGVLLICLLAKDLSLELAVLMGRDIRVQALVAAVLLFAPANFLMGMVSPYVAKLRVANVATVGSTVGRLYAAGTLGSIAGTFVAGYWLISWLGNRSLGLWLVAALVVVSLLAERRWLWPVRLLVIVAVAVVARWPLVSVTAVGMQVRYDGDSTYSRWRVADVDWAGRPARLLLSDGQTAQSGVYLDKPDEPLFGYVQSLMQVAGVVRPKRVLVVGGGTYTLPKLLVAQNPGARVDVVEIDPKLDEIAEQFFGYKADGRVRVIHEDGRTFLNRNREHYDLVLMDAFAAMVPPFQLTTREAVREIERSLAPGGVVAVNLIAAREGERAAFGAAEAATYGERFAAVALGPVNPRVPAGTEQNLILVAGRDAGRVDAAAKAVGAGLVRRPLTGLVLTDDFAPVEQMTAAR
jgi:SAM-dependent methyltransferase